MFLTPPSLPLLKLKKKKKENKRDSVLLGLNVGIVWILVKLYILKPKLIFPLFKKKYVGRTVA